MILSKFFVIIYVFYIGFIICKSDVVRKIYYKVPVCVYFSATWFNGIMPPILLVLINFVLALIIFTVFSVLMLKTKITRILIGSR